MEQVTDLELEALELFEPDVEPQKMMLVKDRLQLCHTESPNQFPGTALNGTMRIQPSRPADSCSTSATQH